jgi:Tol biopolymer transport system component/DNA-binding winged helix-turn-helix (wHTH) protein
VEESLHNARLVRFGVFEVDLRSGELRRAGAKLKLSGQPFQVLAILLENRGEIVTREELQKQLWPDTFVDGDHNLNTAINKIREVLGDSAENPRFIETLPRRGYRFIAPVEGTRPAMPPDPVNSPRVPVVRWGVLRAGVLIGAIVLIAIASIVLNKLHRLSDPVVQQRSLTRLTFDEGLQTGATWSPDGRFIAYSSDRGGKSDIWVQQVSGGNPVQITRSPGQNWQPDWSPDGKYMAYRSEEGDGGIYVIPALGGAGLERKIAPFGYYPRWSPDSSQVLIQTHFTAITYSNRFYVAHLNASPPHEVLAEFLAKNKLWAASADWHPDGKRITVWVGDESPSPSPSFWTVPIAEGPDIKLEVAPAVRKQLAEASGETKTALQNGNYSFSWSPSGDALYFERGYRGATNIWKMTVNPGTLGATGIDRLTTGPGPDGALALSADGKQLAFTAKSQRMQTWLFPFDARTGQLTGNGNAITSPGRTSWDPAISRDGTKLSYGVEYGESPGPRYGNLRNEVWVKSLVDGSEAPVIANDDSSRWFAVWSPDGKQLAYERRNLRTNEYQLMVWSSQSHEEAPLTGDTIGAVYDWSPDDKWLLRVGISGDGIWLVPIVSAPHAETAARKIISNREYQLNQPHLSPDGRWIVFEAVANSPRPESALFVTPLSGGPWARITDGRHWDDKPRWSPDGTAIYFLSGPGGFFNVWGIRFDPAAGKPVGKPFQVSRFDSPRLMIPQSISPAGLSLTQDKLVMTMAEESGSIWILDHVDR